MHPLTEPEIRAAFINATRREVNQATMPDLDGVNWDEIDYLGWTDPKRTTTSYLVAETNSGVKAIVLRPGASSGQNRKKAMCAWCEDIKQTRNVGMFIAKRAGDAGRRGDTVGTLLCRDFQCSRNVRRMPTLTEMGAEASEAEREYWQGLRIAKLHAKAQGFISRVERGEK